MSPRSIVKKKIKFENDDYQKLFDFLVGKFDANDKKTEKQEGILDKLEKVVGRIEITMDFMNERMATKQELAALRDEMLGHIDGLAKKIDDY